MDSCFGSVQHFAVTDVVLVNEPSCDSRKELMRIKIMNMPAAPTAPVSTPVSTPSASTTSNQAPHSGAPDRPSQSSQPVETQVQKDTRWQKMQAENKRLKAIEVEHQASAQDREFTRHLKEDPELLKAFIDLVQKKQNPQQAQPSKDPYEKYDPEVAAKFKELDDIKKWKAEQDTHRQNEQKRTQAEHGQALDRKFNERLAVENIVDANGKGNKDLIQFWEKATLAQLVEVAKNPARPTEAELKSAMDFVATALKLSNKNGLKNLVKRPGVPATGSKQGTAPPQGKRTSKDRINDIVSQLG